MPIAVQCSRCGGKFRAPDEAAGKRAKCPKCSASIEIRGEPATVCVSPATSAQTQEPIEPQQASMAETAKRAEAREQLKRAIDAYSKPIGRLNNTFGSSILLVILAGIVVWIFYSWILGVLGGIAVLAVLAFLGMRFEAPHTARAKQAAANVEKDYGVTHEESLRMLLSDDLLTKRIDSSSESKAFLAQVWGANMVQRIRDSEKEARYAHDPGTMQTAPENPEESAVDSACAVAGAKPDKPQVETWPTKVGVFCGLLTAFILWKTVIGGGLWGVLIAAFAASFLSIPFIMIFWALAAAAKVGDDTATVDRGAPRDSSAKPSAGEDNNSRHENE